LVDSALYCVYCQQINTVKKCTHYTILHTLDLRHMQVLDKHKSESYAILAIYVLSDVFDG
jgi:hypothetical protein